MRRLVNSAVLLAVVAVLTVSGMVVSVSPASADTGGSFDPSNFALNGDPTVAAAAVKGTALGSKLSEGQFAGMVLNKIRYAKGWTAITGRLGFGASGISADASAATQLAQLERAYAPVATKFAPAIKAVEGASAWAFAGQMGISLGAAADRGVGIDVDGGLCSTSSDGFSVVASILVFAGAADCERYKMSQELKALENKDVPTGVTGGKSCGPDGSCVQLIYVGTRMLNYQTVPLQCVQMWAGPGVTRVDWVVHSDNASNPDSVYNGYFPLNDSPECGGGTPPSVQQYNFSGNILFYCAGTAIGCVGLQKMTPQAASADPERTLRCDVTNADGSVVSKSSAVFHEADGTIPPYVCPAVSPGAVPTGTTVWETGGKNGDVKWMDVPTTPEYQTDRTAHPDCTLGQCRLELIRTADSLKCLDAGATCDGWATDPAKSTKYNCQLGPYPMALDKCNAYAPTFNQQKVAGGAPYADPTTGAEVGQTVPNPSTDPVPQGDCYPSGWGVFNPVEWVQKPVGCALQAAFVPSPAEVAKLTTTVQTTWANSTPGKLQHEVEVSIPEFGVADSGCGGILINFPTWSASGNYPTTPEHVLAACPGDYFAQWAPLFSTFIGGAFVVGGLLGIKRLISAMVGLHDPGVAG